MGQRFVVVCRTSAAMKLAPMQELPTIPVTVESRSSTFTKQTKKERSVSQQKVERLIAPPTNHDGWLHQRANLLLVGELARPLCTHLGLFCRRQMANNAVACMRPHASSNSIHASEKVVEPSSQAILHSKKTATLTWMYILGPQCRPPSSPLLDSFRQAP